MLLMLVMLLVVFSQQNIYVCIHYINVVSKIFNILLWGCFSNDINQKHAHSFSLSLSLTHLYYFLSFRFLTETLHSRQKHKHTYIHTIWLLNVSLFLLLSITFSMHILLKRLCGAGLSAETEKKETSPHCLKKKIKMEMANSGWVSENGKYRYLLFWPHKPI